MCQLCPVLKLSLRQYSVDTSRPYPDASGEAHSVLELCKALLITIYQLLATTNPLFVKF